KKLQRTFKGYKSQMRKELDSKTIKEKITGMQKEWQQEQAKKEALFLQQQREEKEEEEELLRKYHEQQVVRAKESAGTRPTAPCPALLLPLPQPLRQRHALLALALLISHPRSPRSLLFP